MNTHLVSSKHLIKGLVLFTVMLGLSTSAWSEKPAPVTVVNTPNVNVVNTSPVPVTGAVRTGPRPSEIVDLETTGQSPQGPCQLDGLHGFFVLLPDPAFGVPPFFVVPEGKVFVITSLNYEVHSSNTLHTASFRLFRDPFPSSALQISQIKDASGYATGTVTIPTGIVFKHGTSLCLSTLDPGLYVGLQGYLADDQ